MQRLPEELLVNNLDLVMAHFIFPLKHGGENVRQVVYVLDLVAFFLVSHLLDHRVG